MKAGAGDEDWVETGMMVELDGKVENAREAEGVTGTADRAAIDDL